MGKEKSDAVVVRDSTLVAVAHTAAKNDGFVVDSLPYIDETSDDYDQYAMSLIEEEMKSMKPPPVEKKNPPSHQKSELRYATPLLEKEYRSVIAAANNGERDATKTNALFSTKLQAPSSGTVEEWREAVRLAKIEFEKERLRGMLFELEKEDGVTAEQWKEYNTQLGYALQQGIEPRLEAQRQKVDQANLKRQEHQDGVGNTLYRLGSQYQELVDKVYQLKRAVATVQGEIDALDETAAA